MGLLNEKVAIITGAGRGIGRAYALAFAREGAHVVVNDLGCDRDGDGTQRGLAEQVAEQISEQGGKAVANHDTVCQREGVDALVWTALHRFGRIDILVNNAGILRDRTLLNMSEQEWDAVHAVHLRGTFLATQAVARVLKRQGEGGRIVNTSSVSGLVGYFGQGNYAAAKAGVAGLTFSCAKELARYNIAVNAIAPIALTRMTEDLPQSKDRDAKLFAPESVTPVCLFLASSLSEGITGRILGVEGPRVFEYRVVASEGVSVAGDTPWRAEQVKQCWEAITALG